MGKRCQQAEHRMSVGDREPVQVYKPLMVQQPEGSIESVDVAAIALAGLAASVTLMSGDGAWTVVSTSVGIALLLITLAFHRAPQRGTLREKLARAALGAVVALEFACIASWFVQWHFLGPVPSGDKDVIDYYASISLNWGLGIGAAVGVVIALREPQLQRRLDAVRTSTPTRTAEEISSPDPQVAAAGETDSEM